MKKILYVITGIVALLLAIIIVVAGIIFVDPTILVNEKNIKWALEHTRVLDYWTWKKMELNHEWKKWDQRRFTADIRNFCFRKNTDGMKVYVCFEEISWDFDLGFSIKEKVYTHAWKPVTVHSPLANIELLPAIPRKEETSPPDIYRYWKMFWSDFVPDADIKFTSINLTSEGKQRNFDFMLKKNGKELQAEAMKFKLFAEPEKFELHAPDKILIPEKKETLGPFYVENTILKGEMTSNGVPLLLTGNVEDLLFRVNAKLGFPLKTGKDLKRDFLTTVTGEIRIPGFQKAMKRPSHGIFKELPAPLNVLDGMILTKFRINEKSNDDVRFDSLTNIDLSSARQALNIDIAAAADLPVATLKPDTIELGLDFHEVRLELPRLSSKRPPPQFVPDKRFKKSKWTPPEEKRPETDVLVHLTALNRKSLHIATNLLDEPLRFNFDLLIGSGKINKGHVTLLPLKTEIFKRPVHLKELVVTFNAPVEPVLNAEINFPLPEYKITLELEGPVSRPRYAFRSDPPLQQNDIYAVLLFGRPLSDLDPDDKTAAQKTNQILANGILSLSVLYFLAGSPVEYVGFDPDSKSAVAQFGLTKKTSLRVGGGEEGMNSGGLRHSLGKGWYIDTGVQRNPSQATDERKSYGVLLERVIAY